MSDEAGSEVVETPVTPTEEQNGAPAENTAESAPASTEEEATEQKETEEQHRSKFQRRLDRQKAARVAAETEARILRERLQSLEGRQQPQQRESTQGAPKLADFDNFEAYAEAVAEHKANALLERKLAEREQTTAAQRQQAEQANVVAAWQERQEKAHDKYDDFEEVVAESDAPVTADMGRAIVESEVGPDIAYYLAKNPKEAERIAKLSPVRQIAEIGKLEDKIGQQKPPPKKPSEAAPPINPVGGRASSGQGLRDELSTAEWMKLRNKQVRKG